MDRLLPSFPPSPPFPQLDPTVTRFISILPDFFSLFYESIAITGKIIVIFSCFLALQTNSLKTSTFTIIMKHPITSRVAVLALVASTVAAPQQLNGRDSLTSVTVQGNAFFNGSDRFYIRGVDYQPGGSSKLEDPIADPSTCKRDIPKFQELGLNTVRVYSVDNSQNHDECMTALADAGIYLVLDVNTPKYSINRADPQSSYNDVYLQSVFATVEIFAKYPNTLAFFSGNEVVNDGPSSSAAPYVKAVTRDIRGYLKARNLRQVPVGYSAVSWVHFRSWRTDETVHD